MGLLLMLTMGIATFLAFKISHAIFRPLRQLNFMMRTIINEKLSKDLGDKEASSKEITKLYEVFNSHIKTKKFEDNGFKKKIEEIKQGGDALAVLDLAEASVMFMEE